MRTKAETAQASASGADRLPARPSGRLVYQNQLNPVAELDGSGNLVSRFVYGTRANVPDYMVKGTTVYRLISDHLGSVRLVVDTATGAVAQRIDYDEFGVATVVSGAGFQPFGFAGGLTDDSTKLVRFGARDYEPATGRWTAKDPVGFGGRQWSLYSYVDQDPVNAVDPTGTDWIPPQWLVNGAAGFGDGLSFGLTKLIRQAGCFDNVVNDGSSAYKAGSYSGMALGIFTGVAGSLNAGARSVFYSGQGALDAALAGKGAGQILGETVGGRALNFIDANIVKLPNAVWKAASAIFAANAKGDAQAFLRSPAANSIWSTVERPILEWLGNTSIIPR